MNDEREFIVKLKARDKNAFVELVRPYHSQLLPLASFYLPNRAAAEEVVQEA
jgi:DNA-directed RNA polymerase specialized sigma24 family protein